MKTIVCDPNGLGIMELFAAELGKPMTTHVTQEEYDEIIKRMEKRRKAVAKAQRKLAKAKTLADKIAAQRELNIARTMPV